MATNDGSGQVWDDLSKLGQNMKLSLDSMLKLQPHGSVVCLGILVRGAQVDIYQTSLQCEGVYLLRRYGTCILPTRHDNLFPLARILELFQVIREEQDEILQDTETQVANDRSLAQYLNSLNCKSMQELRNRPKTNDSGNLGQVEDDDRWRVLCCRRWIYKAINTFADLVEGWHYNGYGKEQTERWYEPHLWRPLIDDYILNHPDMEISRGEKTSKASSCRKNLINFLSNGDHKRMGRWMDGLFVARRYDLETGGIEIAPIDNDNAGSKYNEDSLNLAKQMKDQFDYAL
ncbi:hypothetical protein BGZ76_007706 [Entomortierella beljakovae]|nr:hypothetical protein BGZ76_007706 [Entomortierella beljakovae]